MNNIDRYTKCKGEEINKKIFEWCNRNPNKYKYGCYYCPLYAFCNNDGIKSFENIKNVMLGKEPKDAGPVIWDKHTEEFLKNFNRTAQEINIERIEEEVKRNRLGWHG